MVGDAVFHYKILKKLGEGGMGVVYSAHDTKLHRTVALKFLSERLSPTADEQARLLNEARAAAGLNHPGICSVFDILDHEGKPFIVMEYVEGISLRTRLTQGQISMTEILGIASQIADALAEAHRRGIVHRDIKPENVILAPGGRVKVMDFGMARQIGGAHLTREGIVVGTIAYMSPEQARGDAVDARTDIWSFGILLYELCTGKLPFASEYEQAAIYGILNEVPRSPRTVNPAVPEPLERIIQRCLEKRPEDRYGRIDECLSDLKATGAPSGPTPSHPAIASKSRWLAFRPIALLVAGVALTGALVLFWPRPGSTDERSSIAVLPFKNLNNQEEDAFFAEGLTEDIISQLGAARGLKVIGHSSVMRYKNTEKSFQEVAAELGASTLLEGSVRHVGERIRVVARLVDHRTGEDLWNDTYDRNLQDILTIQSDIARRISTALRLQILAETGSSSGRPFNLEAWRLYQQGKSEWYKRTTEGVKTAISYFEKAVAIDPDFALAHAGLADALALLGDTGIMAIRPAEAFGKAKQEALKALSLDDNLAEGHASLGHIQIHQFEWHQAEQSLRRAVDLNPSSPLAQAWLGLYCITVGRKDEARERFQNALLVDPLSVFTTSTAAAVYGRMGQYDSATAILHRMLIIEPSSPRLHFILGRIYAAMHRPEDAIRELQTARERENNTEIRAALAQAYAFAGRREAAEALLDSLMGGMQKEYIDPLRVAEVYAALGERENAFTWLERALREGSAGIVFLKTDPWYETLHQEPRFKAILDAMGLNSI